MAETVDELVAKHSRRELEKMAYELGVEDVTDLSKYPDKTTIAEALLEAREEREGIVEKVKAAIKPKVKKEEVRIGKKGVFAKRVAMEEKAVKIQAGARELQKGIEAQAKENKEAVVKIGMGVKGIQSAIQAQANENEAAVKKIGTGIKAVQSATKEKAEKIQKGIEEMRNEIQAQVKENESYVKDFYYG